MCLLFYLMVLLSFDQLKCTCSAYPNSVRPFTCVGDCGRGPKAETSGAEMCACVRACVPRRRAHTDSTVCSTG